MTKKRRRAMKSLRNESIGPRPAMDPTYVNTQRGIDVDQPPDDLFDQAIGLALREAEALEQKAEQRSRERQEQDVRDRYNEFLLALTRAGIKFNPGEAQKFEIAMASGLHQVWIETPDWMWSGK